ncbi:MAG: leucine--tRNA ligase [Halobacteriaceae archaeon]
MDYEPRTIERKWQRRWAEGRYEADPDADGEPTFVTVPYPYPSGGMHIGHARTYTVPDVYARYRRLQGDNVLFPLAWHVTGTPIVGAVNRLQEGEEEQLSVLRDTYGVPEADLEELETPMGFARYFVENYYKPNMRSLGLSIDWRREFTTNDDRYSKFITWQYETLRDHGRLEKGLHPVNYCTNEEQPVTTHDLLEGETAEFQEFTLVKFTVDVDGEETVAPMATLRPETVRGVTNAFVDPDAEYVVAEVDGERWFVSREATTKLDLQQRDVEVLESLSGAALVGRRVENPVTGDSVLVLPARFVDPDNATGVVMSVPAHSPDDYVALAEIAADTALLEEYGLDPAAVEAIEPVPILDVEGYGDVPARDAVEERGIDSQDDPALEEVTRDLYNAEFHSGRLHDDYGEYAGEVVEDVRERFRGDYRERGAFDAMYEFTEDVICRCGGDVEVAEQETWFLTYSDGDWKELAHEAVDGLDAIPESTRDQYDHTVDWLEEWPCIRNFGLGTRLPWDDEFVIEPLSDSTIYMAYYTLAHRIDEVPVEALDREFFDALFYGPEAVEDPDERALDLREEFEHWYPVDYRCSGNDLISNHLTFFLFHHADLFEPEEWPEGITVMGMGLLEGEKMSSSKGHVVLPTEAIEEHGADTVRFFLLNSAEPWQDYDWRADAVESTRQQLERFWTRAREVIEAEEPPTPDVEALPQADRWLLSRLQGVVREVTDALDRFETRRASQEAFYRFEEDLRWYRKRADPDAATTRWTRREVLRTRLRLLAPFVPFVTNELHEALTGTPAEDAAWPAPDPSLERTDVEVREDLVMDLVDDVREVADVTGTDPETVRVYAAADWKRQVFDAVAEHGADRGAVMSEVMADPDLRERGDEVNDLVGDLIETVRETGDEELAALRELDEADVYAAAADFLAREFDATVEVYDETEAAGTTADPGEKAGQAVPFRPAIHLA